MAAGYWFAPVTEENSFLGALKVNTPITVEVRIAHSVYHNSETGFAVYSVEDTNHHWFRINGYFPTPVKLDAFYTVDGVVKDGKYGRVLQVLDYRSAFPQDPDGIVTVLRTLPGLDTRAPMVFETLGDNALNLILEDPDSVAGRLKGIGVKLVQRWQEALKNMKESDIILQTLQCYKVPTDAASALIEKYPDIIDRLHHSPYFLAEEIRGFGCQKCDRIALDNGYPVGGLERLEHAMLYVLLQAALEGDCYLLYSEFMRRVRTAVEIRIDFRTARALLTQKGAVQYRLGNRIISVDRDDLSAAMSHFREHPKQQSSFSFCCEEPSDKEIQLAFQSLRSTNKIVLDDDRVYSGQIYSAEGAVASCLKGLINSEYEPFEGVENTLDMVCREMGVTLEKKQRDAVQRFCTAKGGVFVLNGRAGCGKTFTLDIIIMVLQELYRQQGLVFTAEVMAPTGKAAQVVQKATNLTAQTVHKALHIVADRDNDVKLMLREGDKVINTSNNYSMKFFNFRRGEGFIEDYTRVGIVNGETGRIAKIVDVKANGKPHQRVYVRYGEDQYAMYEDTWDELTLAYAMTIHRAQGSQWPVIIAPVMLCNRIMLNRKLFYTLYTRAQESCIIFGTPEAIQYAINNDTNAKRNTWLKQRLSEK